MIKMTSAAARQCFQSHNDVIRRVLLSNARSARMTVYSEIGILGDKQVLEATADVSTCPFATLRVRST